MDPRPGVSQGAQPGRRVIIIGGGAAGFFGALRAKVVNPDADVLILEAAPKCLGKVKISGGGRCNVTHACFDPALLVKHYPRGERELRGVFARFGPTDTIAWFDAAGVTLKTEPDGRIFPVTDDSQTVIDALLAQARRLGVRIQTKSPVRNLGLAEDGRFSVALDSETLVADAVLLATGSNPVTAAWLKALGHTLVAPVPSLFTLNSKHPLLVDLAGISLPLVRLSITVPGEKKPLVQEGPFLITHWGVSGPAVLKLSAWGARILAACDYRITLFLDVQPALSPEAVAAALKAIKTQSPKKVVANEWLAPIPKRLWEHLLVAADIDPAMTWAQLPDKAINRLTECLKRFPLPVNGKGPFKEEFVTAGGVSLKEVDFKTMQSRKVPGLYFAGEVLDIDGVTGGFNFQNAWSTGYLAGEGASTRLIPPAADGLAHSV